MPMTGAARLRSGRAARGHVSNKKFGMCNLTVRAGSEHLKVCVISGTHLQYIYDRILTVAAL